MGKFAHVMYTNTLGALFDSYGSEHFGDIFY